MEPKTYTDYVNLVCHMSNNLEEIKRLKYRQNRGTLAHATINNRDTSN